MLNIAQLERATQNRVIALFKNELKYDYLSDWTDRPDNSNIEDSLLSEYLSNNGYSDKEIQQIKQTLDKYLKLREIIRNATGEKLDMKAYEADMRHLIDTYIEAAEPRKISPFDDMPLLDLIVNTGIADAINSLPKELRTNKTAVAETIENNVHSKIIKEHLNDPAYYEKMSALLDEIIKFRKEQADKGDGKI